MVEVIGIVEQGQIKLPPTIHLPEGQSVRVLLDGPESTYSSLPPLEDEEWTEEEMRLEIEQALRQRGKPWLLSLTQDRCCICFG